jgi:hypothetical protein
MSAGNMPAPDSMSIQSEPEPLGIARSFATKVPVASNNRAGSQAGHVLRQAIRFNPRIAARYSTT